MSIFEKNVDLLGYTHNREDHYEVTSKEIYSLVNEYAEQKNISGLYSYFEDKYKLPKNVVKQKLKQHIAKSYLFKSGEFNSRLHLKNIPKSILQYGALIYALFFCKKKHKVKKYKLIIDDIQSPHELLRFESILNLVGSNDTLCISKTQSTKEEYHKYNFYNWRLFKGFNGSDLLRAIFKECLSGLWVVYKVSIMTKTNLFPISLRIIHSYLSYKALFESNKAEYILQERHYETDSVKNYMFKQLGGNASCVIQKNIFQADPIFFYIDIDVLFSLGNDGYSRVFEYGGNVAHVESVGSLFMEYYWFSKSTSYKKKYDLAIIGINTSNEYERLDSYNDFMNDYYSLYRWAARLSIENPNYNIVLIHHASASRDYIEDEILSASNIKVIDKNMNSYEIAFSSKCAITYGSTMGYELNAHNLPTFFIDPGSRCSFLPERGCDYIDRMRVSSYDELRVLMNKVLGNNTEDIMLKNSNMWCLESSEASKRISSFFYN